MVDLQCSCIGQYGNRSVAYILSPDALATFFFLLLFIIAALFIMRFPLMKLRKCT